MRKPWILLAVLLVFGVVAGVMLGNRGDATKQTPPPDVTPTVPVPVKQGNDVILKDVKRPGAVPSDPTSALNQLFAEAQDGSTTPAAVPRGTRLLSLTVDNGKAVLNVGSEFAALSKGGSHGESLAQEAICRVLSRFQNIKTVTVQVDGKTYEGEHSGAWEDIPVRDGGQEAHGG